MKNENDVVKSKFCDGCNKVWSECFCDEVVVSSANRDFKWEYAHERVSMGNLTQFMEILPKYE